MTEYIDKTEAMRRFKPFGREIPKEQVMAVLARIEALNREPSEDGTLEVKVEDATKIGRVLVSDDKHRGGLYYPDEYEPKGDDLISRAEAIEALGEEPPVWCDEDYEIAERSQWRADIEAIESVPSADRQMVIKCKPFLSEEDFKAFAEQASDQNVILISNEAEVVSTNTSTNTSTKSTNISIDAPADRPRGEWIPVTERLPEEGLTVLTYDGEVDFGEYENGMWYWLAEACADYWAENNGVIAWMPLPEPYKGGEGE